MAVWDPEHGTAQVHCATQPRAIDFEDSSRRNVSAHEGANMALWNPLHRAQIALLERVLIHVRSAKKAMLTRSSNQTKC